MLGISFDSPAANKRFRDAHGFPFDLLSDESKATSIAFGAADAESRSAKRMSVLIGPDGKVVKTYATVKPAQHPEQVLADLAGLA